MYLVIICFLCKTFFLCVSIVYNIMCHDITVSYCIPAYPQIYKCTLLHMIDHQFGFKTKHSADMCIFTVESIIKYYTGHNTPVYTCFLDANKAIDRVNHWTLFTKLIYSRFHS